MESGAAGVNVQSGISIRESQVREWLRRKKYKGEYLLVSTKSDSQWSDKLRKLPRQTFLIVDLYTPVLLEKALTLRVWNPVDWLNRHRAQAMVRRFLTRGNYFLVANRRQREYWIEEARSLGVSLDPKDISVLLTGSGEFANHQSLITNDARRNVVLWFGGIYPWMDPEQLIVGFSRWKTGHPGWKLRILGGFHPGTGYAPRYRRLVKHARRLIGEKQLEVVEWQPEGNMKQYFNDVAFAVHLTKPTREDIVAHRVRLLTLLNAGIGIVTSGHDVISDLLVGVRAGERVKGDIEHLTEALDKITASDQTVRAWSKNALRVQAELIKREQEGGIC